MNTARTYALLKSILRQFAWPKRGFGRVWRYLTLRLTRLKASSHSAALGFAAGAAVSFTPLVGFHFILAIVLAFVTRGSLIAALLGTAVGNPLTFPLIFTASYWIGDRMKELAVGDLARLSKSPRGDWTKLARPKRKQRQRRCSTSRKRCSSMESFGRALTQSGRFSPQCSWAQSLCP